MEYGKPFSPGQYGLSKVIALSDAGKVVAHVNCAFGDGEKTAQLLAAAPAMGEVLQFILDINGSTGGAKAMVAEFKHRAAVALAKAGAIRRPTDQSLGS